MANLTPRPPHQLHFDATPVFGPNSHVIGISIVYGERKVYLDLPPELEKQVEEVMVDSPLPVFVKKGGLPVESQKLVDVLNTKPNLLTRAKSVIKGRK